MQGVGIGFLIQDSISISPSEFINTADPASMSSITSKPNDSIANFNEHLLEFFGDSLSFLLFKTDEKPFPFKGNSDAQAEGEVIEGESEPEPESPYFSKARTAFCPGPR